MSYLFVKLLNRNFKSISQESQARNKKFSQKPIAFTSTFVCPHVFQM